ncbi:SdrD B-like domain-containing protein, partial [uncultured Azohydromonas sp.]|uniref:SdrD B-like domain-containing protein n=1 Tax=uncultured Azohydromonas sp. TaxID=487342 RepID=UPI002625A4D9
PTAYLPGKAGNNGLPGVAQASGNRITGVTLNNGATTVTTQGDYLFGEVVRPNATVTVRVFEDRDDDGALDAGEAGIGGVALRLTGTSLYGEAVDIAATAVAGDLGRYSFANVPPSDAAGYTITETQPTAYLPGKAGVNGQPGTAQAGGNRISGVTLNNGATTVTTQGDYLFGEVVRPNATVTVRVFEDRDDDGALDAGEAGIGGVALRLTGTSLYGEAVDIAATAVAGDLGRYSFANVPPSDAAGYTITETQPVTYLPGKANVNGQPGKAQPDGNVITGVLVNTGDTVVTTLGDYHFGEKRIERSTLSGRVWRDSNHNRVFEPNEPAMGGWTVQLVACDDGSTSCTSTGFLVKASTITAADGTYRLTDIPPGKYQLRFRNPAGLIVGGVWPTDPYLNTGANAPKAGMAWIDLDQGLPVEVINQDLPLDPSGIVYDSRTVDPVAGATVRFSGPGGFNAAAHLLAGTDTVVTDATGLYQFFFLPGAPAGTYTLSVTPPADYRNSVDYPAEDGALNMSDCTNARGEVVDANTATPCEVSPQQQPTSPLPRYFLSFAYPGVDAQGQHMGQAVVNNHIPLDPLVLNDTLIVLNKTTPKLTVKKGEPVPYSISARYTGPMPLGSVTLVDTLPPGFKYLEGSLTVQPVVNGQPVGTPQPARAVVQGRQLQLQDQGFTVNETKKIQMVLAVGMGVGEGEYVNSVVARRGSTDVSNTATASVRVVPDALLDCTDVIGKVYDDRNANGVQDDGEPGLPNVRIATVNGLLVSTDAEGRYHIACVAVPKEGTGSNLVLKLDERTLPSGYRVTSENPASERITRGKAVKVNFGATVHRVVRLALQSAAFAEGAATLKAEHEARLAQVIEALEARPSIVRVAYEAAAGEDAALGEARVAAVRQALLERWKAHGRAKGLALFNLDVEVERVPASTTPTRR